MFRLESQCGCHLGLFIECVCVWSTESSNHAGLVCCSKLTTHKQPKARVPAGIDPMWGENGSNLYNSNELLMLRLSHAHLYSEHFAESDFLNFMAEYQMGFASKRNLQGCPLGNRPGKNSSSNLQGWSWRAASAQHDSKKLRDTLIPWNKR